MIITKRWLWVTFFIALLSGIFIFTTECCLGEPVILSDFSSFAWSIPDRSVTKNSSYATYTYLIPSTASGAIDEYAEHLLHDYGMEQIALSEDPDGSFLAAFRITDSEIKGFRTEISGETVRGCHVLMKVRKEINTEHGSMLVMYVCRGIEVHKDSARSLLIPSPAPPTPQPDAVTLPLSPEPTFYCAFCQNKKKIKCTICGGDGTVTVTRYVAGYDGVGSGRYVTWEEPCPIKQCVDGYIDCPFCSNH